MELPLALLSEASKGELPSGTQGALPRGAGWLVGTTAWGWNRMGFRVLSKLSHPPCSSRGDASVPISPSRFLLVSGSSHCCWSFSYNISSQLLLSLCFCGERPRISKQSSGELGKGSGRVLVSASLLGFSTEAQFLFQNDRGFSLYAKKLINSCHSPRATAGTDNKNAGNIMQFCPIEDWNNLSHKREHEGDTFPRISVLVLPQASGSSACR